ncbi:putative calcium-transporting ATPase 13, plasma membrane-type [Drosera capensis]
MAIGHLLLTASKSIGLPKLRWRRGLGIVIYTMKWLPEQIAGTLQGDEKPRIKPSASYTILNLDPQQPFSGIDQKSLTKLVKEKDVGRLFRLGGVEDIASSLDTDPESGIGKVTNSDDDNKHDDDEVARRQHAFGANTYTKPRCRSLFSFVWEAFKDPTILILFFCAALQSRQFDKLSKESSDVKVDVVRRGCRKFISIFDVVVGDVIWLNIGDQVPADGLLVEGHSLQVDESSMTGESDHVEIDSTHNPFLISGAKVVDGYGRMIVTAVGMNTSWGELMSSASRDSAEQTPLQVRLNTLTSAIGKLGMAVASLVLVVLFVRYFTGNTQDDNGNTEFVRGSTTTSEILEAVVNIVAAAVTIVVVAIPEGLPLAVTLTLAYSMKKMMADQAMVRKLSACETMGSATTICTDKTGTLTLNEMKVTKFYLGHEPMAGKIASITTSVAELIKEGIANNTTGGVQRPSLQADYVFSGSPTEKALLSWAVMELSMDMQEIKQNSTLLHVDPFNSKKKRSGVLVRSNIDGTDHAYWKGAAEMILSMCSHYYIASGEGRDLDNEARKTFEQIIQSMAAGSLRCIAFAHKKIEHNAQESDDQPELRDEGLTLLGMVGLKDPPRPGVKKAVESCQNAGVNIKMITGDNIFTAKAIATECGILRMGFDDQDGAVILGSEFRSHTPQQRLEKVDKICVMARSSPMDKLLMVECLKQKGHVVAVTGDGTNDAPALKEADIGLSMGIQGTEVAKESSDIVILDDNFSSVERVLCWGRGVYNNIQKFIQFQLTVNIAALVINFVAAVSSGDVPLTAVQLLWLNLIMDTLGALALATEKPTKELMDKKPVGRTEPLITNIMWRNIAAQAAYQVTVLLTLQFKGESMFSVDTAVKDTLLFNTFVLCQVFNEFNARKLEKKNVFKGIHRNKLFLAIIGITIVLQVVMVEFLKRFAGTERLNWEQWGVCLGLASASWPIGWIVKCIPVPERQNFSYLQSIIR